MKKSSRYQEIQKEKQEREQRKREFADGMSSEEKRVCMGSLSGEGVYGESSSTKKGVYGESSSAKKLHSESSSTKKKTIREKKNDSAVQRRTVFINNLSFTAGEDDLQQHFASYGTVVQINVVRNSHGKSRGFAYIEFEKEEEAQKALVENNQMFMNRKLEVKLSIPQEERKVEKKEPSENAAAIACTVYVDGLPRGIGEYEFSVFFSKVSQSR